MSAKEPKGGARGWGIRGSDEWFMAVAGLADKNEVGIGVQPCVVLHVLDDVLKSEVWRSDDVNAALLMCCRAYWS